MTDDHGLEELTVKTNIAVAHWGEHADGGGDRVAWELVRVFEDAPFYVGWRDSSIEPDDVEPRQLIRGRFLTWALKRGGIARQFAHLLGWQVARPLRQFDVLITSGNEPLFYVAPEEQTWVAYIHHTNRRQSDQLSEVKSSRFSSLKLLIYYAMRVAYDHNTHKPDLFVVNSEIVKRRLMRYWGTPEEKIRVVYPPIDTASYSRDDTPTEDYYLTLSRLDWHKNTSEIVKAFEDLNEQLIVAGDGPERESLESMARKNVEFAGYVTEEEKRRLLSGAKAFVFTARDEDFGIAPVEALAAGTPLLGVNEGMTQYQVVPGKNGYRHARSEDGTTIRTSVLEFESNGVAWTEEEIEAFADRFSVSAFHEGMREVVAEAIERSQTVPDWYEEHR